jgi:diadenosine tetraphosphate (Ap4A) HIT family hydrolase
MKHCPFCYIEKNEYIEESELSFAKFDQYPVSYGHALIISKRHASNYFDLSEEEQIDMMALVARVKKQLDKKTGSLHYNIGINCGQDAGQTIDHVHIHIIPRFKGDVEDPRGGVRWIIPDKANYWDE